MTTGAVTFGGADLTSCDREAIHAPGAIQPHGVMLVIDLRDQAIKHFAGDTRLLLGVEPGRMAQLTISSLFNDEMLAPALERLRSQAPQAACGNVRGLTPRTGAPPLDAALHAHGDLAIIELEPSRRRSLADDDTLAQVRNMLAALQQAGGLQALCETATREVRAATGFDRVMVYRFLHDGSGKVVAEDKADGIEGFLGLHYPASDIPRQARALYKRNWLRLIPDVDYTPAPLEPEMPASVALDMSDCALRSVSPVHLEYLRNMRVKASLSISIVIADELWGLIACHNHAPRYLDADLRIACELFGRILSLQLEAKMDAEAAQRRLTARRGQQGLVAALAQTSDLAADLVRGDPSLLDLVPADGVAVWIGGALLTAGATPPADFLTGLVAWLKGLGQPVMSTFELGALYPAAAAHADLASGVLALSVSRQSEDYVVWLRGETVRHVTWAGDPAKPVTIGDLGERLTPRKSFDAWKEEKRGQSEPWDAVEIEAAQAFRVWLLETFLYQSELAKKEREATVAHQALLMAELDHRVKNALANIQALVQQTKTGADSVEGFALGLEARIRALAHAHRLVAETHWQGAKLRELIKGELAPYTSAGNVTLSGDDVTLTTQAASSVTMVIHELTTNAAKYGALSASEGRLAVEWRRDPARGALIVTWTERNGPPVSPPTRTGFGSVVIKRSLAHDLKGSAILSFEPGGVVCVLTLPARCIIAGGSVTS